MFSETRTFYEQKIVFLLLLTLGAISSISVISEAAGNTSEELKIEELEIGEGQEAKKGSLIFVRFDGFLPNGKKFYSTDIFSAPLKVIVGKEEMIAGLEKGVLGIKVGGKRRIMIPAHLAYGEKGSGFVPPNSAIIIELESVLEPKQETTPENEVSSHIDTEEEKGQEYEKMTVGELLDHFEKKESLSEVVSALEGKPLNTSEFQQILKHYQSKDKELVEASKNVFAHAAVSLVDSFSLDEIASVDVDRRKLALEIITIRDNVSLIPELIRLAEAAPSEQVFSALKVITKEQIERDFKAWRKWWENYIPKRDSAGRITKFGFVATCFEGRVILFSRFSIENKKMVPYKGTYSDSHWNYFLKNEPVFILTTNGLVLKGTFHPRKESYLYDSSHLDDPNHPTRLFSDPFFLSDESSGEALDLGDCDRPGAIYSTSPIQNGATEKKLTRQEEIRFGKLASLGSNNFDLGKIKSECKNMTSDLTAYLWGKKHRNVTYVIEEPSSEIKKCFVNRWSHGNFPKILSFGVGKDKPFQSLGGVGHSENPRPNEFINFGVLTLGAHLSFSTISYTDPGPGAQGARGIIITTDDGKSSKVELIPFEPWGC